MGKFLSPLTVRQTAQMDSDKTAEGRGLWELVTPLEYQADDGTVYSVPIGFKTDFASVPRIPGVFDMFGDRANLAATLHDYLYSVDPTTGKHPIPDREAADKLLKEASLAQGVSFEIAEMLYLGVRLGGSSHWDPEKKAA
jgi:hypothetical protein